MSTSQDEDERKKRSLEAGRKMLERYKAKKHTKDKNMSVENTEQSDDESLHNEKFLLLKESETNEGTSSRDITYSSVSVSEGEADADLEGLAGRVAELEELLEGKEAIVGALNEEIDHLRAEASSPNSSQSQSSSIHGRDIISLYHVKLQEFERAVNQRDNLIEHLTLSLEQALSARDAVTAQLNALNSMQLTNPMVDNVNLQRKIDILEKTMNDQEELIRRLNTKLTDINEHVQTLEMERETRNAEINDYKTQINNLNKQIRLGASEKNLNIDETLEQQKHYEARVDKIKQDMQHILNKFTAVTNANAVRHQQELKDLVTKHEAEITNTKVKHEESMKILKEENKMLADRLNKELPDLESRHAKELSVFQTQLAYYKKTVEALKLELVNRAESQKVAESEANLYKSKFEELKFETENEYKRQNLHFQKEKQLLNEQIKLHKIQLEEMTSKHITAMSILESKESIERSLEQALTNAASLKQENDILKFKLDDLSCRYPVTQSTIDNSQVHERTPNNKKYDLERLSLSRFDATSVSTNSELCETMYKTFDEEAIQHQLMWRNIQEKTEMERLLSEKIRTLEEDLIKANDELKQADLANKAYEKQLKDMKNTSDKLQPEVDSLRELSGRVLSHDTSMEKCPDSAMNIENGSTRRLDEQHREIESLKMLLEQKESENASCKKDLAEMTDKTKKLEAQCEQLKDGLANAWAQCAEIEEKLNQTMNMNDSNKVNASMNSTISSKQLGTNESLLGTNESNGQSTTDQKKVSEFDNTFNSNTLTDDSHLKNEHQNLYKKLQQILEGESSLDEIKLKLCRYYTVCEKIIEEKAQFLSEDASRQSQGGEGLQQESTLDNLCMEKKLLTQEIEDTMNRRKEELETIKADSAKEINRLRLLLQNLKDGSASMNNLKAELESRHAKEMEELRTYFERKCLQMEKQYSEEVFSQSKRISDNDSETEELTDDLYFGGAGDCLNASNSRAASPSAIEESLKIHLIDAENQTRIETEYENDLRTLRQELEHKANEIQNIRTAYKKAIEEQKELFESQIRDNEMKLERLSTISTINQYCQTEWEALENGELSNLRAAYNHQLQEQIELARRDIVNDLLEQFKTLLSVEEDDWPAELLELRDKFTCNVKLEIQELKKAHNAELARLKGEYDSVVTRMLEQHQKEINLLKTNTQTTDKMQVAVRVGSSENSIAEERDNLWKTCATLQNLIGELIKYFIVCEEEVNNTLINEVLKRQLSESVFTSEEYLNKDISTVSASDAHCKEEPSSQPIKRVHFAPQLSKITSIVNSDNRTLQSLIDEDLSEKLKKELKVCLRRLRSDSTEILNFSSSSTDKTTSPPQKTNDLNKINDELSLKLNHAEVLIMGYQDEIEQLKVHILELQRKLISAESKKEVITEGYGESDLPRDDIGLQDLSQLQEKARHVLSNGGGDTSYLLQLIEELCRQNDKLMDDARKDKEDLQQQIEAADKQLRATRRFLDEQASEREMERDDTVKQIRFLQEQLKEREREKDRDMRINSESELSSETTSDAAELQTIDVNATVEALESQMREMSSLMSDTEAKKSEKESELKAAVDKIWVLRDIISDLEQQLQAKTEREESLQMQISQLETVITAQTKNQQELVQELDAFKSGSESRQLNEQIGHLEEELHKHKLSSEHFNINSSVLKQMKAELHEMQNQLDKRIRELESAHMCGSNLSLSQPSEDVSIREQIDATRCLTPDDPTSPPMLPLDQVLKLKDKMLKHARAEDVAFKRIKDLEMQLATIKNQNEELIAEQEILHQTASEQLFQIETMRGRLEQHKQSAPFVQKQATSRLELQLHEATTKYHSLEQIITDRELEVKELRSQLDRTNQLLAEKEMEVESLVQSEHGALQKLKDQLKMVQEEKKQLQMQLGTQQEHTQLPPLIDTILADKNEEIDHLKEQLAKKEKQLEAYSSFALNDVQLKQIEPKNSARTLSDIISIHSECEEFPEAIREPNVTNASHNISSFKVPDATLSRNTLNPDGTNSLNTLEMPLLEADKMETQVPPLDLHTNTHSPSNFVHNSESESHTEDESKSSTPKSKDNKGESQQVELLNEKVREIENLSSQLQTVQRELELKSNLLMKYEADLNLLHKQYQDLYDEYKEITDNLLQDKNFYKGQYELSQASENKIKMDLEEVENILKLRVDELDDYKSRIQVNERILTELNAENMLLKREVENRDKDQSRRSSLSLQEKTQELQRFKELILEKDITLETLQTRNIEIENENKQLYDFKTKVHVREQEIARLQDEVLRLTDGLNSRDQLIRKLEEMARRTSDSQSGASSPLSHSNKDQEIHHLQEFLKEKDKVIRQMSDDSKSLHRALETIQNKMKESGNVVELRKKLKDERRLNAEMKDTLQRLEKELEDLRDSSAQRSQDDSDIEDMVQQELNLSARLDKQLMEVINDDVEEVVDGTSEEHQYKLTQVYKDNEMLRRLKDDLEVERDVMKHQIVEYEDRILELKAGLIEETKKVMKLNKDLATERNTVQFLRMQIEEHRRVTEEGRGQDTELIEFLQNKLKASLENEEKLRNDLASMNQQQINLDSQLASMRKLIEVGSANKASSNFAVTVQNELQSASTDLEKDRDNNAVLRDNIKRLEVEMSRYEKRLEIAMEERERLISSLALANGIKEILEADLKRTAEELKTREEECDYLQKQIQVLTEFENRKQEQRDVEMGEIKGLRREINIARETRIDLKADIKLAKQELKETAERELKLARTVESLKEREAELNTKLVLSKERERKLREMIEDLQASLNVIAVEKEESVRDLKSKLSEAKDIPASFVQQIKELNEKAEKYATERNNFQDKLGRMREDKESLTQRIKFLEGQIKKLKNAQTSSQQQQQQQQQQQPIPVERLQSFYGKYLRVESRRKALAFQKKYLLCIIGSYQYCEENTLCILAQLTQNQRSYTRLSHGKVRLKIVVLMVISTIRMKWLIQRWRTGKRVGANALMGCVDQLFDLPPTRKSTSNHSPPVRERATANGGSELHGSMFEQYYHQHVRNFQQTVESAMAESETSHIISE